MSARQANIPVYSVTQLNAMVKAALDDHLPARLVVSGEISNWKRHSSGHCYFILKDQHGAQVPCVMWASMFKNLKFAAENGMAVFAVGHIEVYVPGGKYQLYVDRMEPAGMGALQVAFEQMRRRLEAEGLFKDEHKKPIPRYPFRIGVVTSRSGAAIMDIADSIYNRWPCCKLAVFDAPVQGEGAAAKIAEAIRMVNQHNDQYQVDLLIVGRGGGSMEDLWAFNEEAVARAIFDSTIPVISAVGHEVDVTIADLVADARASTPTKAGVIAVPDVRDVLERLNGAGKRLNFALRGVLLHRKQELDTAMASSVFRNPQWMLAESSQRLDDLTDDLKDAVSRMLVEGKERISEAYKAVARIEPRRLLGEKKLSVHDQQAKLLRAFEGTLLRKQSQLDSRVVRVPGAVERMVNKKRLQLNGFEHKLAALDPRAVLNRGYSLTTNKMTGQVVTSVEDVNVGDEIVTELKDNQRIESQVSKIQRDS